MADTHRNSSGISVPVRLLVVDKVSVLASIRERYERLVQKYVVDLTLLAPTCWIENFTKISFQLTEGQGFKSILGRVVWPGREQRSFYISGMFRAFRIARPDVILMMEESFSLFGLQVVLLRKLLAPSAPVIFYSNNITSYERYAYRPSWFYRLLGHVVMRQCDAALCVNATAEEVLHRAGFKGEVRTLFYGINERLFAGRCSEQSRMELGIEPDTDVFLYAGKLLYLKGIQDLIEAFSHLGKKMPDRRLRLVIVGSGEYGDELRELVSQSELNSTVDFHPMVPIEQMPTFVSAATALVLPSRAEINEQFGRVIAEAMLMNVTVIGSTSGAIQEVIGDGGYIYTAGDVDGLVRCMEHVLLDPLETERRRTVARQKALDNYSMDGFVNGLARLLETLTDRSLQRYEGNT